MVSDDKAACNEVSARRANIPMHVMSSLFRFQAALHCALVQSDASRVEGAEGIEI